jgi:hypothetical protein
LPPGRQLAVRRSPPRESSAAASSGEFHTLPRWNHFITASGCWRCNCFSVGTRSAGSFARNDVGSVPIKIVQ